MHLDDSSASSVAGTSSMVQALQNSYAGLNSTFWRTLQTFSVTRLVISLVLFVYVSINIKKPFWIGDRFVDWDVCLAYLLLAAVFAVIATYYQRRFIWQLLSQIALDITAISLLYVAAGGAKSGLSILYLFPLAGGAILAPFVLALFFVSIVTLVLLMDSGYQLLQSSADASISHAGLYGAAFFAAVFVINRLAVRLIKQENLAVQRGQDLQVQEAINRLVIADMGDGILVVGVDSAIFICNPAAERMLGWSFSNNVLLPKLMDIPALMPIAEAFFAWQAHFADLVPGEAVASTFVHVKLGDDTLVQEATTVWGGRREWAAHLKLRFAAVKTAGLLERRTVIFMQDVTEIENQAQQLKLASMGRLTASIAHEVRNPLSAISYAASLLGEEEPSATQSRLLNIVSDNVRRLNQMIEDILKLSRKAQSSDVPLTLAPFFTEILEEFEQTHRVRAGVIQAGEMDDCYVWFDPLHLREVVANLLSNALRYASSCNGSIRIQVGLAAGGRLELHVQDDGPPITPEVRAHLFEPFYTTSSKGTGLGLYVARELCLNNGAMLDYEYRFDHDDDRLEAPSGRFVITCATPQASVSRTPPE